MQFDPVAIRAGDLNELADVMYLAWRREFILDEKTGSYSSKRDFLLEQIASLEKQLETVFDRNLTDEKYDYLFDLRREYVNQLFHPLYGAIESPETNEDLDASLAIIGEDMGWEMALEEVNKRFPKRLKLSSDKRGRHWQRASYFHILKDFSEILRNALWNCYDTFCNEKPAEFLGISRIEFVSPKEWHEAMSIVVNSPSDDSIFVAFQDVMKDRNHRYYQLFKAVNSQTDLLLLGSLKALERSLANGRKSRR